MGSYAAPLMEPRGLDAAAMSPEAEWPPEAIVDLRALGRGVCWALAIEGAAALCFYGAWHLWHVWR